ncbi:TetR/AcrR family transcriptional regulator [Congregibacter variabilis]|uniref:TetR/AcrR family transcriptional regulator n=1 Tax=Congregibacter variabilis TaxID=3081200 RepID=A0ABZ0HZZ0_9GAMM|nr:TetR/AcrR family transcriptional regulator [Congregibacter sp. IMCC43200]
MTDNARRRSRERLEERERGILDAATKLFATAGFHATSTRKIAAAAGVSEGTVFHYFGSKNELMLGILDRFYNEVLNPRAAEILDTIMDTRGRLRALAMHHVSSLAADNALMMRLLQVYVGVDLEILGQDKQSPLRDLNRSYVGHLDRAVREGVERGDLRNNLETRPLRDLFFGTLEYGLRTHMYRHGTEGLDAYVDALLQPLWEGLSNSDSPATPTELLTERLEKACERLERTSERWEKS